MCTAHVEAEDCHFEKKNHHKQTIHAQIIYTYKMKVLCFVLQKGKGNLCIQKKIVQHWNSFHFLLWCVGYLMNAKQVIFFCKDKTPSFTYHFLWNFVAYAVINTLNGIMVRVFFKINKKKHLCRSNKNYYYLFKANIPVICIPCMF